MLAVGIGHSTEMDADDAAREVIRQCKETLGEATVRGGLLFAAIDFEHQRLLDAVNDAFPGIALIGCTTDGELSSKRAFQEDSVTLLVLGGEGIEITSGVGKGLSKDCSKATRLAAQEAQGTATLPHQFCLITPDGMHTGGVTVIEGIKQILGTHFPVFGGLAGDQWRFDETLQFHNREVLTDAVPLLLFSGRLRFSSGISSGWKPLGKRGIVTKAEHNILFEIDDAPALDFYRRYLGDEISLFGEHPLAVYLGDRDEDPFYFRAPLQMDPDKGSILFAGDVPIQSKVRIATGQQAQILDAARVAIEEAVSTYPGERPEVAFLISCAARKQILGTKTERELLLCQTQVAKDLPICGFYAYGEIGPPSGGAPALFHNETFVTLLFGTH